MAHIPPPRPSREQGDITRYAPTPHISPETPKKVGEILGTQNILPGKKRPFYPLWHRREMMKNGTQRSPFSERDLWERGGEIAE